MAADPEGVAQQTASSKIALIELHARTHQQDFQFLQKIPLTVMLLLILDIAPDLVDGRGTDGKRRVPLLPREGTFADISMNLHGGCLLRFPNNLGNPSHGPKSN